MKKSERETVINCYADESEWKVFSDDKKVINRLNRLGYKGSPMGCEGMVYKLPYKAISFRNRESVENPKSRGVKKGGRING